MTEQPLRGRLLNADGELIAEGPCWLDEANGQATLEPERTPGVIRKERGHLALELDSGRSLRVSDRPMVVRIRLPRLGPNENGMRSLYRLRLIDDGSASLTTSVLPEGRTASAVAEFAQDAEAAGAAGEGAPAVSATGRPETETPAAR